MKKRSIALTAVFTALSALLSANAGTVNWTVLASEQANTGDNAATENITSTQAPSSSGRYTDDAGNIYRYSIINDGAAVSIDGKSLIKSTEIVLPSYIEGLPVETVDGNVIRNTNVTSITLPETCKKNIWIFE